MARAVLAFDDLSYDVVVIDLSDDISELLRQHHAFLGQAADTLHTSHRWADTPAT